jgi:methyltransferase (TIGR00027 family)
MEKVDMTEGMKSTLDLGATACWTAAIRARENKKKDALIQDPWAEALAGEKGMAWIEERTEESVMPILLRTRYFDDFLQRIVSQQGIKQIVLMGAGMDTRAFRLSWPEKTHIFELDQSSVLQYKEQILQAAGAVPACQRRTIAVDLSGPWQEKLIQAGFDPKARSVSLLEGFLFYLPESTIAQLLDGVTSLASQGSWMGFDIVNKIMLTHPLTRDWVEMQAKSGAPWLGTMEDPVQFLAKRGWEAHLTQAGQEDANYGRWLYPVLPTLMPDFPHNWFVTAVKNGLPPS